MYEYDDSNESDYSFEYSDYEYNSLEPYTYELNDFKEETKESPEDKLLRHIQRDELTEIQELMPSLLVEAKCNQLYNGNENLTNTNVSESGDNPSDLSDNESSDYDEDKPNTHNFQSKYQEIFLKNGDTPLITAAVENKPEIISYFISLGFNVNFKIRNTNKTALLALLSTPENNLWIIDRHSEKMDKVMKCIKILLDNGADVRAKCYLSSQEYGHTALHYAVENDYWAAADAIVNAGADVDATNNNKLTPLHIAASKGHVACVNALLLSGANTRLLDKSGNTAADLSELEGYNHLSDAINVYSGKAQHNVRLYKIWRQYTPRCDSGDKDTSFGDIDDNVNLSHSCIESFSLALNAPYLTKVMEDQGISINDLKFMDESKLKELGVSEHDCKNVINALKDLNKKPKATQKINFSYGRPLKSIAMLEMLGNIGEHIEFIDTNIEALWCHLNRNEKFYLEKYRIVNKSTMKRLQSNSRHCIELAARIRLKADKLKNIINKQQNEENDDCASSETVPVTDSVINNTVSFPKEKSKSSLIKTSALISSVLVIGLSVAIFSKRYL